jgi:photosystem II stability/assembly factor-like uncharacterized protein
MMTFRHAATVTLVVVVSGSFSYASGPTPPYDPALYQAMKYRSIGPYRGGRVTAVTGVRGAPDTFYMGSTGGGVWKTDDGGETWTSVSDETFTRGSVGAVAVAPSDPNVVWVGTGSACIRGNVSPGNGVYRSTDAGKTWSHVGLRDGGQIGRIRVDPRDPDRAWVAVLGHAFGPNPDRGVYRTTDGGATWERVLHVSDRAGAVDLALDPGNPRILFAAIWETVRRPWTLDSGGEESGLYRSTDGGDTWEELTNGLPEGLKGRIGVTVSAAQPGRVWTLVEAEEGGLFRSDDGGDSFRRINDNRNLRQRAWYYTHIFADPRDPETVYVLNVGMYRSTDGGKSFTIIRGPHSDHHDLWIDPDRPEVMINGNDGGATVTVTGGRTWSTQANQPTAEFYRVSADDRFPYRVYGAQQDNSTVSIASRTASSGITVRNWYPVGGGESGYVVPDPADPEIVYAGSYGGTITRYDHRTRQSRNILAYPQLALGQAPRDLMYRFQWNAPILVSSHDPAVLYHAANVIFRSTDEGHRWEAISPDLTRDDIDKQDYSGGPITWDNTGVEVYGTVFALEQSLHEAGVLWAGTDDGRVHLSRDGGESWNEITPEAMPEWGQVNMIELSAHAPGRAFLAVTRYRMDDFTPYVFRTDDYGATWTRIADGSNGIPDDHFVRVVREDPDRRGLLYAGTEFGAFVSFDDGSHWQSIQLDLPATPITDMVVKDGDLVVATQGRAFWILDDLTPLHQLDDEIAAASVHLFRPRDAYRFRGGDGFGGAARAVGQNPPNGTVLHYLLAETPDTEVVLEILDDSGKVIRRFSSEHEERHAPDPYAEFRTEPPKSRKLTVEPGMNRFVWDHRYPDAEILEGAILWGSPRGPKVVPGTYQARLTVGDRTLNRSFAVLADPRLEVTDDDLRKQFDLSMSLYEMLNETQRVVSGIRDVRGQVDAVVERLEGSEPPARLGEAARTLDEKLTEIEQSLDQTRSSGIQDPLNFPPRLDNQILYLYDVVNSADAAPTVGALERYSDVEKELQEVMLRLGLVFENELAAFNRMVFEADAPAVIVPPDAPTKISRPPAR